MYIKFTPLIIILIAWSLIWKGLALWKAARKEDEKWFIAMLVLNTFGIIEIIYIYHFYNRKKKDANKA